MTVKLVAIKPGVETNCWDVVLDIANQLVEFSFVRQSIAIGQRMGWVLTGEPRFYEMFQFNQHITAQVNLLLRQVIQGQALELPLELGVFYTPEQAHAIMSDRREDRLEAAG